MILIINDKEKCVPYADIAPGACFVWKRSPVAPYDIFIKPSAPISQGTTPLHAVYLETGVCVTFNHPEEPIFVPVTLEKVVVRLL